jgi:hypothetical protein
MEPDQHIAVDDEGYDTNSTGTSYVTRYAHTSSSGD